MHEHRKLVRVNLDRVIVVKLTSGTTVQARLINLSIGGLAICYPAAGELGAELGLTFQLPQQQDLITISTQGIVRHTHVTQENFITGIEFKNLKEEDARHINNFIDAKLCLKQPTGFFIHHRHKN